MRININNVFVGNIYVVNDIVIHLESTNNIESSFIRKTLLYINKNNRYIDLFSNNVLRTKPSYNIGDEFINLDDGLIPLLELIRNSNQKDFDKCSFHPTISKRKILSLYKNNNQLK